ncbi:diguanylate cyclase [Vibrio cyclitrophicus FF160]|uniref:GGDEF domain-containing protein n=1 Tax=Vibrio cyclitrophicus TaxID=47951 RepID=UPI0003047C6B|nr:diguanylate cyclase [Vibrio cyclitrophicus]OEE85169.1 diguanylate cyclase [Vibrio cyclitrophicus FF160]PMJ19741.1 diguanylate cyclase [Vibrio cyclitrophicus]
MQILILFINVFIVCLNSVFASPLQVSGEQSVLANEAVRWYEMPLLSDPVDFPILKKHIESSPRIETIFGGEGAFGLRVDLANSDIKSSQQIVTLRANYLDQGWGYWQSTNGQVRRILDFGQLSNKSILHLHRQSFPLILNAEESGTLWLYLEAKKFPKAVNFTLQPEYPFYIHVFRNNTLTLASITVMLTLGVFALFCYFQTKHPVTLACAGYVGLHGLGWFAASGAWGYLLPSQSWNPVYFGMVLFPFAVAFSCYYTRLLFGFPQHFIRINLTFQAFSWLCVIIGFINVFAPFSLTFVMSHLIAVIWVPTMIVTGVLMVYQRNFVAKYYLIGGLCYGTALVYYIFAHFAPLPTQRSTEVIVVVALAIDCACILLSLTEWLRIQQHQHQKTYIQSRVDSLTGLGNRLDFNDASKQLVHHSYCIVFIDCDGLKSINDTYGHDEGDRFLEYTSRMMREKFTDLGMVYRAGGDEFIWLLKVDKEKQVEALYSQIELRVTQVEEQIRSADWPQSGLSFGSASSFECVNFSECLSLADQRMYQQKRSKNGFKNQSSEIEC